MRSASILVVEDDAHLRGALCRVLRGAAHTVAEAESGDQARRILAAATPDLVITDLMMPDGDGIEVLSEVRRAYPDAKVLVISGRRAMGNVDVLRMAKQLGAHATLQKPIDADDLLKAVAALLG